MPVPQVTLAVLAEGPLETEFGEFLVRVYHDGKAQAIVLLKGALAGEQDVLCRIHSACVSSHVFSSLECGCRAQVREAQRTIAVRGQGLIIYLDQEGRGNGAAAYVATLKPKRLGVSQHEAFVAAGFAEDAREYRIVPKILSALGIRSVELDTSSTEKEDAVRASEIGFRPYRRRVNLIGRFSDVQVAAVRKGTQRAPIGRGAQKKVFVIGDLNVDYLVKGLQPGGIADMSPPIVGGTAFNAAAAFQQENFHAVVFGKVGSDPDGDTILGALEKSSFDSLVARSPKQTGQCLMLFDEAGERYLVQQQENANDYDLDDLDRATALAELRRSDYAFVVAHAAKRLSAKHLCDMLLLLKNRVGLPVVLDVVPHNLWHDMNHAAFMSILRSGVSVLIAEYNALGGFLGLPNKAEPSPDDLAMVTRECDVPLVAIRYGTGNISRETILRPGLDPVTRSDTGYESLTPEARRGFGDLLTARLVAEFRTAIDGYVLR